jgi:hypothetical protein
MNSVEMVTILTFYSLRDAHERYKATAPLRIAGARNRNGIGGPRPNARGRIRPISFIGLIVIILIVAIEIGPIQMAEWYFIALDINFLLYPSDFSPLPILINIGSPLAHYSSLLSSSHVVL